MTFHVVDLAAGAAALELALAVEAWRKRDDLATVLDDGRLLEQLEQSVARLPGAIPRPPLPEPAFNGPELRDWLQSRINTIGRHIGARATLQRRWPAGVAPLARQDEHTDEELHQIEQCCDAVEAMHSLPFPATRPYAEVAALRWITTAFPGSTVMDEPTDNTGTPDQGAQAS